MIRNLKLASHAFLLASLFVTSSVSKCNASIILFDIDSTSGTHDGVTLSGWTGVLDGTGNDGTVSVSISGFAGGRDRGTNNTTQGADNGDNEVPEGIFGDMYRDFLFAGGGANILVEFTHLEALTTYTVDAWTYDSGATGAIVEQEFFVDGNLVASVLADGDNGGGPGPDPNTDLLSDYGVTFSFTTDGSGAASFTSSRGGSQGARINGIRLQAVPEPSAIGIAMLASLGMCLAFRRQ